MCLSVPSNTGNCKKTDYYPAILAPSVYYSPIALSTYCAFIPERLVGRDYSSVIPFRMQMFLTKLRDAGRSRP